VAEAGVHPWLASVHRGIDIGKVMEAAREFVFSATLVGVAPIHPVEK
jgi:hypothetical protein